MRSFILSAVLIASVLIGQQWVAKASEPRASIEAVTAERGVARNDAFATWAKAGISGTAERRVLR